jgi:hypothetical protein
MDKIEIGIHTSVSKKTGAKFKLIGHQLH